MFLYVLFLSNQPPKKRPIKLLMTSNVFEVFFGVCDGSCCVLGRCVSRGCLFHSCAFEGFASGCCGLRGCVLHGCVIGCDVLVGCALGSGYCVFCNGVLGGSDLGGCNMGCYVAGDLPLLATALSLSPVHIM